MAERKNDFGNRFLKSFFLVRTVNILALGLGLGLGLVFRLGLGLGLVLGLGELRSKRVLGTN